MAHMIRLEDHLLNLQSLFRGHQGLIYDAASLAKGSGKKRLIVDMESGNVPLHNAKENLSDQANNVPTAILPPRRLLQLSRADVSRLCKPLFEIAPEPAAGQLDKLVDTLQVSHPGGTERSLVMSIVRKWFRKQREYVTLLLAKAVKRQHNCTPLSAIKSDAIGEDPDTVLNIIEAARLPFELTEAIVSFCQRKLAVLLDRRTK